MFHCFSSLPEIPIYLESFSLTDVSKHVYKISHYFVVLCEAIVWGLGFFFSFVLFNLFILQLQSEILPSGQEMSPQFYSKSLRL